jgi:hypothetical protein
MKLPRKEILQKSLFTISVFALGIVASGGVEKRLSPDFSRRPASSLQNPHLVKIDSVHVSSANPATCDYSTKNHKACENK